ncbi:VWA domain-containing protein [bacterium]|nr:VWA domain-containing protein [bacterium]
MHFANPIFFLLLLLIPYLLYSYFKNQSVYRSSMKYSDLDIIKKIPLPPSVQYRHILIFFRAAAITLLIIAFARPQSGRKEQLIMTEGLDIILTMDISGSMAAEDFKPNNRLDAAKVAVENFIQNRQYDRIGMVVFSRNAFTQCPLTLDYGLLINFLKELKIGMIQDGTAIGMGIATALKRLEKTHAKSKIIILLTDGVNNAGEIDPLTAAELAKTLKTKVYAIGMGKEGGAPIPIEHSIFGKVYARNPDGSLQLTKIDEDTLRKIAEKTGGKYFRATDEKVLSKVYDEISNMEKTDVEVKDYTHYTELMHYFLLLGLFLLLLDIFLSNTRFQKLP